MRWKKEILELFAKEFWFGFVLMIIGIMMGAWAMNVYCSVVGCGG